MRKKLNKKKKMKIIIINEVHESIGILNELSHEPLKTPQSNHKWKKKILLKKDMWQSFRHLFLNVIENNI